MIEHEGTLYARVSEVLNQFSDYSVVDEKVLKNKSRIGNAVHKAIERDIQGEFPYISDDCMGYFESYELWKNHLEVKFIASETRYFHKERRITGQIDALILPPGSNLPVLVDFKTCFSECELKWKIQSHLYYFLIRENGRQTAPNFLFVKLNKKGKLPIVYQYKFDPTILARALNAVDEFWKSIPCDRK